ncbi:MAG: tol-pal system protein YbgF [Beijerinckiaceae bacterium]|nr:tol-pal system protein YbgF [Beijerinckiaceae bacterium]
MLGMMRFLPVFLVALALPAMPGTLRAQDAADFVLRLDRLENENRRLTGQVEELRFQLRRVEDQLKRFQTDADTRFRDLETGRPGGARPPASPATPPATTTPQRRSDAFDPATTTNAPGAPRPLGQSGGVATAPGVPLPGANLPAGALPPGGTAVANDDLGAPLDVTGQRRPPAPAPAPVARGDAASDFAFAKSLVDRGDFELAEGAFRDFLRTYGRDRRVPEATFWLGESYLRRTRYREAAEQFLNVTSKHANAPRAPEAMLKLGISLRGLGATAEACGIFNKVTAKYPNTAQPIRAAVEREKARAQC